MKLSSHRIQNTSTLTQPVRKPIKPPSLSYHHRHLNARPRRKFVGKELDIETGLYYYGARYLDPKISRWLSGDPAVGEYVPSAPASDEARKQNQNLPGMGGVFNYANLHVYHYGGNNPVKLVDPDGKADKRIHYGSKEWGGTYSWALNKGFDETQGIFYTLPNTLQKHFGYYNFYEDHSSSGLLFRIDSFHVQFESGGETYSVRGWKGNYWGAAGGEIGIYSGEGPAIINGYSEPGSGADNIMITMEFTLSDKSGKFRFTPPSQKTWWLYASKPFMNRVFEDKRGAYIMQGFIDFEDQKDIANAFEVAARNNSVRFERVVDTNKFIFTWE